MAATVEKLSNGEVNINLGALSAGNMIKAVRTKRIVQYRMLKAEEKAGRKPGSPDVLVRDCNKLGGKKHEITRKDLAEKYLTCRNTKIKMSKLRAGVWYYGYCRDEGHYAIFPLPNIDSGMHVMAGNKEVMTSGHGDMIVIPFNKDMMLDNKSIEQLPSDIVKRSFEIQLTPETKTVLDNASIRRKQYKSEYGVTNRTKVHGNVAKSQKHNNLNSSMNRANIGNNAAYSGNMNSTGDRNSYVSNMNGTGDRSSYMPNMNGPAADTNNIIKSTISNDDSPFRFKTIAKIVRRNDPKGVAIGYVMVDRNGKRAEVPISKVRDMVSAGVVYNMEVVETSTVKYLRGSRGTKLDELPKVYK